jgi:pSer/pThr/pTyr-binding forkhead associated (FHA) protein/uncharacterized RDD family membrane protein YckC
MSTNAAATRYRSEAPSLVVISGHQRGRRIPVPSMGIVLGREGKLASLFGDDPVVSRGHAHVYLAEDRSVQVADLNSTNGTFVNGEAIRSLTRLADRDVLRIGSIDMQLDVPGADNRPADETVRLYGVRTSWPDPPAERRPWPEQHRYQEGVRSAAAWPDAEAEAHYGLGEVPPASACAPADGRVAWRDPPAGWRAPPEQPRYEEGHPSLLPAAAWPDAEAEAHYGLGETPAASAAAYAPPDARPPLAAETLEPVSFAPHALRLLAFTIDLFLVAVAARVVTAVTGSLLAYAIVLLTAWVAYQTASVWLTGGRTIGKAACSLSVRHIDGSAPRQDRAGLAWAFGRASLGYLVIDICGLGVLVALRSPRRRCLHDYAFASEVILHPDTGDPLHPRSRLERLRQRLQHFTEDRESAWEAKKKKYAFVPSLWNMVLRTTEISLGLLLVAGKRWHALVLRLAAHAHPAAGAPAAKALTVGKLTTLVTTTSVATGTAAVAATAYLSAPIIGNWGPYRINRVGVASYQGTQTSHTIVENGCTFYKGQENARISGHGQHFTGYDLWVRGSDGQNCRYIWEPSTFNLIGTNTLRICTTNPALRDDPRRCRTYDRTLGR